MLLNQASNKTCRERERERAYCTLHFYTRFDEYLKHICNEKKTHTHTIYWQGHKTLALTSHGLSHWTSCFNIGRKTSVKALFDHIEALSSFTP